ncbi:MAG: hypothetical protein LAO08_14595 [Acidobacteriia bacterium]|nr:hypothetical protein [Terriglobia bacterium]
MRKSISTFLFLIFSAGFFLTLSTPAMADDDPPGRVARLNYIQGSVSFQPGGESDWVQANPNRPLTTGDNLWTDRNSRGELHIGSTVIRLWSETGITFLNLDDRTVQIQLAEGSLSVHVRRLDGGDAFEIDTPNLAFTVQRPGEYRVDVDPNGNTTVVTVRQGEGNVTGGGSEYDLDSGDRDVFSGTDSLTYDGGSAGRMDDFDQWVRSRDDREERAESARYVSRDVIGYEDLDDYGDWRNVPDYGYVWFPARMAPGWAPYRFGHWVWIEPWGWTWVEDEPWGFAPFHYGRWAVYGGGWCWVPGPVVVRPVYSPALVVFVGGPRFGISLSIGGGGGVGWFPLGPREVYVPPYRTSVRYVQNVNITNTTVNVVNVTNIYNNRDASRITYMHRENAGAVTVVSRDTFVNARPVGGAAVRVDPRQLHDAEVQRGVSVAPVRQSVVGSGVIATVRPPQAVMNRQVVVKQAPAPPPVSFQKRQQVLAAQPGSAPTQQQLDRIRAQQVQPEPAVKVAPPSQPNANQPPAGRFPTQQQNDQRRGQQGQQGQQQPPAISAQPTQPNVNQPPVGRIPTQPQNDQRRGPQAQQGQQQPPASSTPPSQPNVNQPQSGRVPTQQQTDRSRGQQVQQQPPASSTPPSQPNVNQPQSGRVPTQQQTDRSRGQQVQQQPPVIYAPPARVNQDTYHPHQFEKPQNAAPQKPQTEQPKGRDEGQQRGQDSKKSGGNDQERKQR